LGITIKKEEINELPIEEFSGKIVEILTETACDAAIKKLSKSKIVGFDTETRPSFSKGFLNTISLIQLSTHNTCYLFRLNYIDFPPSLMHYLSDPQHFKVGLSLRDDFHNINRWFRFKPQGFLDLQDIIKNHGIDELSLQKIYAILFQKKISKGQRLSNWEAETLSEAQQKYAAIDAWACIKIYEKLCPEKKSI
jgi:ribonuclease D